MSDRSAPQNAPREDDAALVLPVRDYERAKALETRGGYRRARILTQIAIYFALVAVSLVYLLPFLWSISTSLKSGETVFDFPPDLIPRERVSVKRDGKLLRVARHIDPEGVSYGEVLIVDSMPGRYVIEPRTGTDRSPVTVPRDQITMVKQVRIRWENYPTAWTAKPFNRYLVNTLIITLACIIGQVFSASLVGFGFSRLEFPGRTVLFFVMLSTMMLPSQVTMIPQYLIYRWLGWIDTFLPLTVPSYLGGGAFFIFLFRQFFMTLPRELDEAATVDGCSGFRVYWNVLMPLCKPVVATIAVFSFITHWNEFMGPLIYLNSPEKQTLALGLRAFQGTYVTQLHLLMAASLVVLLPILVVFFLAQKHFVKGVVLSGIKA